MGRLLKALVKLLKGKVKIHIGAPGSGSGVDISLSQARTLLQDTPVQYNIMLGLWKALKAALMALLAFLLATGGIDRFFQLLAENIPNIGIPVYLVPIILGLLKLLQNLIKQALASIPAEVPEEK